MGPPVRYQIPELILPAIPYSDVRFIGKLLKSTSPYQSLPRTPGPFFLKQSSSFVLQPMKSDQHEFTIGIQPAYTFRSTQVSYLLCLSQQFPHLQPLSLILKQPQTQLSIPPPGLLSSAQSSISLAHLSPPFAAAASALSLPSPAKISSPDPQSPIIVH